MRMKCLLLGVVFVGLVSSANAEFIGSDGFDYADGPIVGQNGGTGWDRIAQGVSEWEDMWGGPSVSSGELTTDNAGAKRKLGAHDGWEGDVAVQGTGQVYFAATMTVNVTNAELDGGWGGMSSYDFDTERIFFGRCWQDSYDDNGAIADGSNGLGYFGIAGWGENDLTDIAIVSGEAARIVGCIDFENDQLLMWVNPDASDYHNVTTGASSADAVDYSYDSGNWITAVRLASGSSVTWDDLVVATDAASVGIVPEPATVAILGFGAVVLVLRRKK